MSRMIKYLSRVLVLVMLLSTCANERAISGGAEDKTAPRIIYSTPENESVRVGLTTRVFIKFNEQMRKSTFAAAVQIWPRPPGGYELKTGWTWLSIIFNEPLVKNETYLLTLDKSAQDLRGNGLESTYILAFSTGEKLNSGRLAGKIFGSRDIRKNGDLLLYRDFNQDLSVLRQLPADYIFQPDDDGRFELPYLSERSYMLFYHWDRNHNKLIDGDDYFGRPVQASVQARADSLLEIHRIWPSLQPLEQVKLLEVSELEEQFIQVRVGRPFTRSAVQNLHLFADKIDIPILGASLPPEDEYAAHINIALPIQEGGQVWLQQFQDTSGFMLHSDTLTFLKTTIFDTLALQELDVTWKKGSRILTPDGSRNIQIQANLPFVLKSDSAFQLVDRQLDSIQIGGELQMLSSMLWEFSPDTSLEDGHTFQWQIQTSLLHAPLNGRELDSLMTGELEIISADSLGSLKVMQTGNLTLICKLQSKDFEEVFKLASGLPHRIKNLPAQTYTLSAYEDQDGNGRYNSGGLGPASGAEPSWVYPGDIRVRARWETDLGIWELDD